jgi:hypothetical protein
VNRFDIIVLSILAAGGAATVFEMFTSARAKPLVPAASMEHDVYGDTQRDAAPAEVLVLHHRIPPYIPPADDDELTETIRTPAMDPGEKTAPMMMPSTYRSNGDRTSKRVQT